MAHPSDGESHAQERRLLAQRKLQRRIDKCRAVFERTCGECGYDLPPPAAHCPVCGADECGGQFTQPYDETIKGDVKRFEWAWDQRIPDPQAKLVFMALVSHDMRHGHGVFPAYDRLQIRTGLSRDAVAKAIQVLEAVGWIRKQRRGVRKSNLYTIHQAASLQESVCQTPSAQESVCQTRQSSTYRLERVT